MIARKEIVYRFRAHGATWGLWARLDASLYTDDDVDVNDDDRSVVSGWAWLRHGGSLAPSVTDKFANVIVVGRAEAWDIAATSKWLVVVNSYTINPADHDENTPTLAMFEWLKEILGPGAVEPVVLFDGNLGTYRMTWRQAS